MNYETELATLKLFNEKADRLERRNFTKSLKNSGCKISSKKDSFLEIKRKGPNEEEIDAFILTYRFFIQNNEKISLKNMSDIYNIVPVSHENKENFYTARDELNEFLDGQSSVVIGTKPLTYRHIVDIIIYGGLSHANVKKKRIYGQWMSLPISEIITNEFIYALSQVEKVILFIRDLNSQIITELQKY